jgi:hypothetical protein
MGRFGLGASPFRLAAMRRSLAAIALAAIGLIASAPTATAGVGYSVIVDSPRGVARGSVAVTAHVTGGVGDAEHASYQISGGSPVQMEKTGPGKFGGATLATEGLANGDYELEVRVWGDVPPYDPSDPGTYARQSVIVSVDNAPPAPSGVAAVASGSTVRVTWGAIPTSDRSDFAGYRVLGRSGTSCSGTSGYRQIAELSAARFTAGGLAPGAYCYRVAALRSSPVSGTIASGLSAPVRATIGSSGGGGVPNDFGELGEVGSAVPPRPPVLGDGSLEVSDGRFNDLLPYGPKTITQQAESEAIDGLTSSVDEPGVGPKQAVSFVAAGLILSVAALLLRRFLAFAPER